MQSKKLISVMTPCYNEEGNIRNLYQAVKDQFDQLPQYDYEHIFIDNYFIVITDEVYKTLLYDNAHFKSIVTCDRPVKSNFKKSGKTG